MEIAKRSEPVPSSINDRVNSVMEGERFSLAKPTQSHVDSYNIAAAEFADQLGRLRTLVEVDLNKAGEGYGGRGGTLDAGAGAGMVGQVEQNLSPRRALRFTKEIWARLLRLAHAIGRSGGSAAMAGVGEQDL